MFYAFRQNNSGGAFAGPAVTVIVEADSFEEANDNSHAVGVYFDDGMVIDCSCCGARWSRQYSDTPDGYGVFASIDEALATWDVPTIVGNDGYPNVSVLRKLTELKNLEIER